MKPLSYIAQIFNLFYLFINIATIFGQEWCYNQKSTCAVETWGGHCKIGQTQSPINLIPVRLIGRQKLEIWNVQFSSGYYSNPDGFEMENVDQTVEIELYGQHESRIMSGAGFSGNYIFSHLHLHWGNSDEYGSEHKISGRSFPLELHLVHNKVTPGTGNDELAVLGIFYTIDPQNIDNPALEPIIDALRAMNMRMPQIHTVFRPYNSSLNLSQIIPSRREPIFRYTGSLTTPACNETVLWTIFQNPQRISRRQMDVIRAIRTREGLLMSNNFRPVQKLNGRRVFQKTFSARRFVNS